jgi:hypothetical protein
MLLALASTALALSAQSTPPSHLPQGRVLAAAPSSADPVIAGFEQRVHQYLDLAGKAAAGAPKDKPTKDIDTIDQRRKKIAAQVMAARPAAKQGDIFTPDAAALFRRLLAKTLAGPEGARIRASLRRAEPVMGPEVKVNQSYPNSHGVPLQSTPPSLLLNLPPLSWRAAAVHPTLAAAEPAPSAPGHRIPRDRPRASAARCEGKHCRRLSAQRVSQKLIVPVRARRSTEEVTFPQERQSII